MKIACGDGIFARPGYHTVSAASAQTYLNSNESSGSLRVPVNEKADIFVPP